MFEILLTVTFLGTTGVLLYQAGSFVSNSLKARKTREDRLLEEENQNLFKKVEEENARLDEEIAQLEAQ